MRCAPIATRTAALAMPLEPDLRCPGSQPAPTLYALEILSEAGAADSALARDARGWIAQVAAPDGGIPSVLLGFAAYPHAPWFAPGPGSILTLALAAALHAGGRDRGPVAAPRHELVLAVNRDDRAAGRVRAEVRLRIPRRSSRRGAGAYGDRVAHRPRRHLLGGARRRRRGRDAAPARPLSPPRQPLT